MIPAGFSNALAAWAGTDSTRAAQLIAERDALVANFLNGGQGTSHLAASAFNGSSFTWDPRISAEEKLDVLTEALLLVGAIPAQFAPTVLTYANFSGLQR